MRAWCADIAGLVRSVGKRVPAGNLTCVCGFGSQAWDRLLDFSTAVTGGLFFVPSADLLEALAERTGGL